MRVSAHAIEKYTIRARKDPSVGRGEIEDEILAVVNGGREVVPKDQAKKLINNGFKDARYFSRWGIVAIVVDEVVVTAVHKRKGEFKLKEGCR